MPKRNCSKDELQKLVPAIKLGDSLGEGGNARVFSGHYVSDKDTKVAVKFMLNDDRKRYGRFRDEVLVVTTRLKQSKRVIPILEHYLPDEISNDAVPWYSMPIAHGLRKQTQQLDWLGKLKALTEISDGLVELHFEEVAHRDIKPENLFYWEGTYRFGDFGIAKFPERSMLTTPSEPMGPASYMAPEMASDTENADALKADVYSLAKTVWAILTGEKRPFVGQYLKDRDFSINKFITDEKLVHEPLDKLFTAATDADPGRRPTARQFAADLHAALKTQGDFEAANTAQWQEAEIDALFQFHVNRAEWYELKDIAAVLAALSRRNGLNHLFFPDGGGTTITGTALCEGGNMMAMSVGDSLVIVKPARLTLERFSNSIFNYAALETADVSVLGSTGWVSGREDLMQLNDFDYSSNRLDDDTDGVPRVPGRLCSRYFKGGLFVIAPTTGVFNRVDDYLGSANTFGRDGLRERWEGLIRPGEALATKPFLKRKSRYVKHGNAGESIFRNRYLSDAQLGALLTLEDKFTAQRAAKKSSRPNGIFTAIDMRSYLMREESPEEVSARELILALTPEQRSEYLALAASARSWSMTVDDFFLRTDEGIGDAFDDTYAVGQLQRGFLRKALEQFGVVTNDEGEL